MRGLPFHVVIAVAVAPDVYGFGIKHVQKNLMKTGPRGSPLVDYPLYSKTACSRVRIRAS